MPTEPTPIVAGSTEISAPGAVLRVSRVDLTEVGRAMLQTHASGLPALAMTPELLNDYDRHSNRMHTHAALPPPAPMPTPTDDLVARLRNRVTNHPGGFGLGPLCDEAVDAIERLQAENQALRAASGIVVPANHQPAPTAPTSGTAAMKDHP